MKIQNKTLYIVIGILLLIIFFQRSCSNSGCGNVNPRIDTVSNKIDTHYVAVHDTVLGKSKIIYRTPAPGKDSIINVADSAACKTLLFNFNTLRNLHYATSIYKSSFNIKYGRIDVYDTVSENQLRGSTMIDSLNIPVVTNTITIEKTFPEKKRVQLYIGGGLQGSKTEFIQGGNAGLLLKTKKDQIYGANVYLNNQGIQYGISMYWKIKF